MLDRAREDIGDCLDSTVGMPRKTGDVIERMVVAEIVEQQERIEIRRLAEAERAMQLDACAFQRGLGLNDAFNRTDGHESPLTECALMND